MTHQHRLRRRVGSVVVTGKEMVPALLNRLFRPRERDNIEGWMLRRPCWGWRRRLLWFCRLQSIGDLCALSLFCSGWVGRSKAFVIKGQGFGMLPYLAYIYLSWVNVTLPSIHLSIYLG